MTFIKKKVLETTAITSLTIFDGYKLREWYLVPPFDTILHLLDYEKNWSHQGSFTSVMEWAPFKCLFWNVYDSVVKLMVSITSGISGYTDLVIKYVKLYQRQPLPKTYENTKVDFLWL